MNAPEPLPAVDRRWPAALRWFGAEFLVVVTGVLVALALGAWWQERDNREREVAYLQQLAADLEITEQSMRWISEFHIESALASARAGQAFWKPEPPTLAELSADLVRPFRSQRARPVLGTIEALIATGDLRLIRSNALRTELTTYAEFAEATIENIQRHDETYYRPGVNALVENLDTNQLVHEAERAANGASEGQSHPLRVVPPGARRIPFPIDIEALLSNRALYAAYYKLLTAHRNQSFNYSRIMDRARRLRSQVYRQLHGTLDPGNCQLTGRAGHYSGQCGELPDSQQVRAIELSEVEEIDTGAWPVDPDAYRLFTGRWTLGERQAADIVLEVDIRGRGLIHTADGHFPFTGMVVGDFDGHLSFRVGSAEADTAGDAL